MAQPLPQDNSAAEIRGALLLSMPMMLIIGFCFVFPILWIARISLYDSLPGGILVPDVSLGSYITLLGDDFFRAILLRSVLLSALVTVLTLVLTYPVALFLHRLQNAWKGFLIILTVAPLLISMVVRTYGWMVILDDSGILNGVLAFLGLPTLRLSNDYPAVVIGLTQILMPYMALCLISGFGRIDPTLEEAAESLGARPLRRFLRVTLPLSMPGVALGCMLTFVLAMSSFVTPTLLGGGRVFLLATEIYTQALEMLDWPAAAAMSIMLLTLFMTTLVIFGRFSRRGEGV